MDKTEERLASFVGSLRFRDIEPQVLHAIKRRFIDSIGCALGAFQVETSRIARNIALKVESTAKAGVIGTRVKSSSELAAFANTAMIRCLDLNDDYFGKDGPHPSDTIGAILAVGDSSMRTVRRLLMLLRSRTKFCAVSPTRWDCGKGDGTRHFYCSGSGLGCRQGA